MKITHVIRGEEWLMSTSKHLAIYDAFGWKPPLYAHVGLLQDANRQKFSKRNCAVDVATFRDMGVLPETLINYLALLGWSHQASSDVMSKDQLIEKFDLSFTKGTITVAHEKLWYLQKQHAAIATQQGGKRLEEMVNGVHRVDFLRGVDLRAYIEKIVIADAKNYERPEDFLRRNIYYFVRPMHSFYAIRGLSNELFHKFPPVELVQLASSVEDVAAPDWTVENLVGKIKSIIATRLEAETATPPNPAESDEEAKARSKAYRSLETHLNLGLHHYLRWAVAEGQNGARLAHIMWILGRDESLLRLKQAARVAAPPPVPPPSTPPPPPASPSAPTKLRPKKPVKLMQKKLTSLAKKKAKKREGRL
ncbi:MAG: Glutamate--tRNA ligase mitochondrial [Phylliscum demangeonii]|nr:MAG: Glutamate--tRNA ligase mitochondrial [Phylliscum demangeonii]